MLLCVLLKSQQSPINRLLTITLRITVTNKIVHKCHILIAEVLIVLAVLITNK